VGSKGGLDGYRTVAAMGIQSQDRPANIKSLSKPMISKLNGMEHIIRKLGRVYIQHIHLRKHEHRSYQSFGGRNKSTHYQGKHGFMNTNSKYHCIFFYCC
jgi:hypothetical protein